VTNIRRQRAKGSKQKAIKIIQAQGKTIGLAETYGDVKPGGPLALWGSHGFLEIAVNQGNAEKNLKLRAGVQVLLEEKLT
jgi:S-adenosylmethionine hydrolase